MAIERDVIWHKTGRILGAYRFAYDDTGRATLEELHAAGWAAMPLANAGSGGGGASSLGELSDVTLSTPSEGHVLTWDAGTGAWVNATPSGGTGGVDAEGVQDAVGAMFAGGTHENVTVTYDDTAGTLSLVVAAGGTGGLTQEQIEDLVSLMVAGPHSGIAFAYDDAAGTLTATVSGFQPADATLSALASLDTSAGVLEQTGPDTFAKRPFGVGGATSLPTRADADARYAALVHGHVQADVVGLVTALAGKVETSTIGAANGIAPLSATSKVPSAFLEVLPSEAPPVFPAGGTIPSLTVGEQALVTAGTVVVQDNGQRYMYKGSGSKTATASYVLLSDLSPDWSEISGIPATFPPTAHTHPQADVTGLTAALALKAPLASPALTGLPTAPTPTVGDVSTLLATTAFVSATVGTGGYGVPNRQAQAGAVSTGVTTGEQVVGTATAALTGRHSASVVRVWAAVAITKGTGTTAITWTVRLRRGTTTSGTLVATATATSSLAGDSFTVPVEGFDALGAVAGQYVVTVQGSAGNGTVTYYQTTALEVGGAPGPAGATGATGPAGASGATTLDGLTDVVIASPATDQVLKYTGTQWQNAAAPAGGVANQDTGVAPPTTGTYAAGWIRWNSAPSAAEPAGWVCVTAGTPGTWEAIGGGKISAAGRAGIDPTGATSSTVGLQALIDTAFNSVVPLAKVFIPPGDYLITDANADGIGLIIPDGIIVEGAGWGTRLFATTAIAIIKYKAGGGTWKKSGLHNFRVDGNSGGVNTATAGIIFEMEAYSVHSNIIVWDCIDGIVLAGGQNSTYIGLQAYGCNRNWALLNGCGSNLLLGCGSYNARVRQIDIMNDASYEPSYTAAITGVIYYVPMCNRFMAGVFEGVEAGATLVENMKMTNGILNTFDATVFAFGGTAGMFNIGSAVNGAAFHDCSFYGSASTAPLVNSSGFNITFENCLISNHLGDVFSISNYTKISRPMGSLAAGKKWVVSPSGPYAAATNAQLDVVATGGGTAQRPDGTTLGAQVRFYNYDINDYETWDPIYQVWRQPNVTPGLAVPQHKLTDQAAKTAAYSLVAADSGTRIPCSSVGGFTVTVPSAATLGNGFSGEIINIGTGSIIINGPGATDITLSQHEACYIFVTGGVLYAAEATYTAL